MLNNLKTGSPMNRPSIFSFTDYRLFLKTMFAYKKETAKAFSHRNFSRLAGFSSPNFLKLVIDGQRNLTSASISKIAEGFKLKKPERDYFETLVYMNQAEDLHEKNHYYKKLITLKTPADMKLLENARYEYFSRWYLPVLRELVMFDGKTLTPAELAEKLSPRIAVKEVDTALKQLQELGLIYRDENGCWRQSEPILTTGPEVKSLLIKNFHHEMIKMAAASIDRYPADKRDITAVTMSVRQQDIPEIKRRIADFRKEMLKEFAGFEAPDQVIQINVQMFPLTKIEDKEETE